MAKTEWQLLDSKLHLALRLRGSQKFLKEIFRQL